MDLVLWRHADAEDGTDDLARPLTPRGHKQAQRVAAWLEARLPAQYVLRASPAVRARETAAALSQDFKISRQIAPGASAEALLKAAGWPGADGCTVLVGHQPSIGAAAGLALTGTVVPLRVRKGAVWWLRSRPDGPAVIAVISPEFV